MRKAAMGWLVVMLVVLGLGSVGRAAPVPQTIYVGENAACDYSTIAAAITNANPGDIIKVQYDTYNEPPLVVNKALTLIGGYWRAEYGELACLTQTGVGLATVHPAAPVASPIFRVQGANVRVQWFIFENSTDVGVAVDSGGTLDLVDSIVQNNGDGGLRVVAATANLLRTKILDNNSPEGGGIYMNTGASVTASDSLIKGNQGWDQGAGVYLEGGSAFNAIEGTGIERNRTVMGCENGGGIAAIGPGTEVLIDASQVISNTALTRGGGLYLAGGAQASLQNGYLVRENGTYGPVEGGGGGAHLTGGSALHADDGWFYQNWSDPNGAGIYADLGSTVQVYNTWFYDNLGGDSGGGIYNNGSTVTCQSCIFYQNRVVVANGGAISSIGTVATLDLDRAIFIQNTTDAGNGGAVYANEPYTAVRRSYFSENTAPGEGSAIFLSGMHLTGAPEAEVVNSYIVDNPTPAVVPDGGESAPVGVEGPEGGSTTGSSLYAEYITAYLKHNTFAHEIMAPHYGVLANSATVQMVNNIFTRFTIAIHRLTPTSGAANASFTLFWDNATNYDPLVVTSTDQVIGNPAFVGGTNYNLTASSAAINAGTDAGVYTDYFGGHRPFGGGFEIGAEEYPRQMHVFLPAVMK